MIRKIIKRIDWIAFIASGLSIVAFGVWCAKMPADIVIGVCFASGVWLAVINGMFKEYIYEYRKLNKALDKERMEEFKRFMVEYRESYDSAPEEALIPEEDDDEISVSADSALIQSNIPYGDIHEFLQRNGLPLNVTCENLYISDKGRVNTEINGESIWKDLSDEDFLSWRKVCYYDEDVAKKDLLIKYFGFEIMAAASKSLPEKDDYTQYIIPDGIEMQSAEVYVDYRHSCSVSAIINGHYEKYKLGYRDILAYFEVDEKGKRTFSVMPEQLMMKYICLEGHLQHDEDISDANSSKIVDPGSEGIEGESNRRGFYR